MAKPLKQSFYARDTVQVARDLIGKRLVSEIDGVRTSGVIVETEAYLPRGDSACHAFKHRTDRTEVMFGPAGFAYVYPIHSRFCFNIVTEQTELGCAVLIRSLEPREGVGEIETRRGLNEWRRLTTGPARLCQAMAIDRAIDRLDVTAGELVWVEEDCVANGVAMAIKSSKRIGVTSAKSKRLRYYVSGNRYVSGPLGMRT